VDELPEDAFVSSEGEGGVKTAKAAATQSAAAFGIQGISVLKRRPATDAEELGVKRLRRFDAAAADRKPGDLAERLIANPAGIREKNGKKGVRGGTDCRETIVRDCGSATTREDPPPASLYSIRNESDWE
jgi:hypothetical protein